jgi:hypothetical protein
MDGKKDHLFFKSFGYRLQIPPTRFFVLLHRAKKHVFVSGSSPKAFNERLPPCVISRLVLTEILALF